MAQISFISRQKSSYPHKPAHNLSENGSLLPDSPGSRIPAPTGFA